MTADRKDYLGDGVYVEVESCMVKLTTSNGITDTNTHLPRRRSVPEPNQLVCTSHQEG